MKELSLILEWEKFPTFAADRSERNQSGADEDIPNVLVGSETVGTQDAANRSGGRRCGGGHFSRDSSRRSWGCHGFEMLVLEVLKWVAPVKPRLEK